MVVVVVMVVIFTIVVISRKGQQDRLQLLFPHRISLHQWLMCKSPVETGGKFRETRWLPSHQLVPTPQHSLA